MTLKACTVVVHDLPERHRADWVGDIGRGLTTVTVKVRNPEVTHTVKIQDFENWLNRGCSSPKEMAMKARLRQMLGMGG